jgi:pyrimidine operon attenuation protein/uracil phosphoribosyltransferase
MPVTREKSQLMSASEIDRTLVRLAHEILEKTADLDKLAFIGIRRRGVPLAQRLPRKSTRSKNSRSPSASSTSISTGTICPRFPTLRS